MSTKAKKKHFGFIPDLSYLLLILLLALSCHWIVFLSFSYSRLLLQ